MCQRLVSSTLQTHQAGFVTQTKTSVAVKSHQTREEAVTKLLDDCDPRLTNETPRNSDWLQKLHHNTEGSRKAAE